MALEADEIFFLPGDMSEVPPALDFTFLAAESKALLEFRSFGSIESLFA